MGLTERRLAWTRGEWAGGKRQIEGGGRRQQPSARAARRAPGRAGGVCDASCPRPFSKRMRTVAAGERARGRKSWQAAMGAPTSPRRQSHNQLRGSFHKTCSICDTSCGAQHERVRGIVPAALASDEPSARPAALPPAPAQAPSIKCRAYPARPSRHLFQCALRSRPARACGPRTRDTKSGPESA